MQFRTFFRLPLYSNFHCLVNSFRGLKYAICFSVTFSSKIMFSKEGAQDKRTNKTASDGL